MWWCRLGVLRVILFGSFRFRSVRFGSTVDILFWRDWNRLSFSLAVDFNKVWLWIVKNGEVVAIKIWKSEKPSLLYCEEALLFCDEARRRFRFVVHDSRLTKCRFANNFFFRWNSVVSSRRNFPRMCGWFLATSRWGSQSADGGSMNYYYYLCLVLVVASITTNFQKSLSLLCSQPDCINPLNKI